MAKALEDRFWSKVEKSSTCWNWTAGLTSAGYGAYKLAGSVHYAHRLTYEASEGTIPQGLFIDHICWNRRCVRPSHLRLATHKQNMENLSPRKLPSRTGIRGVFPGRRDTYKAAVKHQGRVYYLGTFTSLEDANAAVVAKRNELFTHNTEAA